MQDDGKVVIINGGSRGIGLEAARRFLDKGWRICVTGRKAPDLEAALAGLSGPDRAIGIQGASDDATHQADVVQRVLSRWSRIDALVNNAATSPYLGPTLDASHEQIMRGFAVNVAAPWSWCKCVYDMHMRKHGGSIVNVASIGGTYPVPRVGVYNITKAALVHLTRQLALELAPHVRVNAVAPATIKTGFARAKYEGREQEVADQYPLKRMGMPADVARPIVDLCGEETSWITGQIVIIDGGASLIQGVK